MDSLDQLQIETPEHIALELPLAGAGSRFLALVIDTLLQVGAALAAAAFLFVALRAEWIVNLVPVSGLALALFILFLFCLYWGYFAAFEALWKGQTPGKRYAQVRVIGGSGRPVTPFEAIARNLLRAVDGQFLYGIGLMVMLLNSRNRRLGDFVAGTVVVHDRAPDGTRLYRPPLAGAAGSGAASDLLTPQELLLAETYLARRHDLEPAVSMRMAVGIATRIRQRTGLSKEVGQSPDAFIEALVKHTRDAGRFR